MGPLSILALVAGAVVVIAGLTGLAVACLLAAHRDLSDPDKNYYNRW